MSWDRYKIYVFLFMFIMTELLICHSVAFAQDIHYSQFFNNPIYTNPANYGLIQNADYRIISNNKNQWHAIPVPYNTSSISVDGRLKQFKHTQLGTGIQFMHDNAGDANLKTNSINTGLALHTIIGSDTNSIWSIGFNIGLVNQNLNFNNLKFDNQFNGDIYVAGRANGEAFATNKNNYFDFNLGTNYSFTSYKKGYTSFGFSVSHLNQPVQSFGYENKLAIKNAIHFSHQHHINNKVSLLVNYLFNKQSSNKETVIAAGAKFNLRPLNGYPLALYYRTIYRAKDACVFSLGIDVYSLHVETSYDFNLSSLKPASNNRGGAELAIIYLIQKRKQYIVPNKICPVYL